jgi:hypothetical protein
MAFRFRRVVLKKAEPPQPSGGWYADPFGSAARRWYDDRQGWRDRVQGPSLEPDKTGLARIDEPWHRSTTRSSAWMPTPPPRRLQRPAASVSASER